MKRQSAFVVSSAWTPLMKRSAWTPLMKRSAWTPLMKWSACTPLMKRSAWTPLDETGCLDPHDETECLDPLDETGVLGPPWWNRVIGPPWWNRVLRPPWWNRVLGPPRWNRVLGPPWWNPQNKSYKLLLERSTPEAFILNLNIECAFGFSCVSIIFNQYLNTAFSSGRKQVTSVQQPISCWAESYRKVLYWSYQATCILRLKVQCLCETNKQTNNTL